MLLFRLVGLLYLVSGLWCGFQAHLAAEFVGYTLSDPIGLVEFVSVYGGIQVGIGLAILFLSRIKAFALSAVIFSLFISASLLAFRLIALVSIGVSDNLLMMAGVECLIVVLLVMQYRRLLSVGR